MGGIMLKWSELTYNDFYNPWNENEKAVRGYWLIKQGIDLENLPTIFNDKFIYFEKLQCDNYEFEERKVYLNDIIGTSHRDYGNMEIIKAYMKIKRAKEYIMNDSVTKIKYNKMLKKAVTEQDVPIILSENKDGTYFVDGNGNHRIVFYKMMLFSEIALEYSLARDKNFDFNRELFKDIKQKYWLNAKIKRNSNAK